MKKIGIIALCFSVAAIIVSAGYSVEAQRRDYLTDDEIEIVRDAQQIDQRITVLVHAADRRFAAIGVAVPDSADSNDAKKDKKDKDSGKWGAAPTGTKTQLLDDVRRILQKAVDDIDNLATRQDSIVVEMPDKKEKPKTYQQVFPKAVHILAAAARRYQPLLEKQAEEATDEREKGVVLQSLELCKEIIDAEPNLSPDSQPKKSGS